MDSGIENMEVEDSDRREKRNLAEKVNASPTMLDVQIANTVQLQRFMKRRSFFPGYI